MASHQQKNIFPPPPWLCLGSFELGGSPYLNFFFFFLSDYPTTSNFKVITRGCLHTFCRKRTSPFQARKIPFKFPYKVGCEFIKQKYMNVNVEC